MNNLDQLNKPEFYHKLGQYCGEIQIKNEKLVYLCKCCEIFNSSLEFENHYFEVHLNIRRAINNHENELENIIKKIELLPVRKVNNFNFVKENQTIKENSSSIDNEDDSNDEEMKSVDEVDATKKLSKKKIKKHGKIDNTSKGLIHPKTEEKDFYKCRLSIKHIQAPRKLYISESKLDGNKHKKKLNKDHLKPHLLSRTKNSKNTNLSKNYTCNDCDKKFYNKKKFFEHKIEHIGKKNVCCKVCGIQFARKKSMKTHLKLHTSNN